uniref:Secreted protein n=1 Tax=Timema genevievae TaxID=629358 RepID=A0A7R9PR43_TIMGE|nr:unnamed protein product [Timema genevievae]
MILKTAALVSEKVCLWTCALVVLTCRLARCWPYDPEDEKLSSVLPPEGMFEAFYPREVADIPNGPSRPPHGHGSFYQHRNPALVDTKNAPAYGFRFDGGRRFNYD